MPYTIRRNSAGQYCVYRKAANGQARGDTLGCHDTRDEAIDQIAAVTRAERQRGRAGMSMTTTRIPFNLDAESIESDGWVYRPGKIFEAGDYEDKDFSITPEELAEAIAEFEGCEIGLEHVPTVLDGKLGRLERVSVDGMDLFGVVALPAWLDEMLGDEDRKVSAEFDRESKRFCGLHIVRSPRVTDAALMAAFTAAEGEPPAEGKGRMSTLWDQFVTFMKGQPAPAGSDPPDHSHNPPAARVAVDNTAQFAAEMKQLRDDLQREKDARIAEWAAGLEREATRFADDQIKAGRALPVERNSIVFAYRQAALDDRQHPLSDPVTFGLDAKGAELRGSRLDGVRHQYNTRQPHDLLREMAAGQWPKDAALLTSFRDAPNAEAQMSDDRRRELLNYTPTGRAAMTNREK